MTNIDTMTEMTEIVRPVVVVADDDADICELAKMQLTRHGFQVFCADDGAAALELIGLHRPVVALLDIMMPKMNGLEVARRVRADPATSHVGIIIFSARSTFGIEEDIADIGVDDYIEKPFSPKDLVQRINAVISNLQTNKPIQQ
ncbi:MAG: response regulator [Actinobacteria bacterium]|nr:MAG: response regulator [Actinomycetota bacterium]